MPVALQTRIIQLEDEVGRLEARISELDTVHRVKVDKLRADLGQAREEAAEWRGIAFDVESGRTPTIHLSDEEKRLPWET